MKGQDENTDREGRNSGARESQGNGKEAGRWGRLRDQQTVPLVGKDVGL